MAIQHTITQNPEFALITVQLQAGQKIYSEPGAMASMDDNIKLTASLQITELPKQNCLPSFALQRD